MSRISVAGQKIKNESAKLAEAFTHYESQAFWLKVLLGVCFKPFVLYLAAKVKNYLLGNELNVNLWGAVSLHDSDCVLGARQW